MGFILVTTTYGQQIRVNTDHILTYQPINSQIVEGRTLIVIKDRSDLRVRDSVSDIDAKIKAQD